MIYEERILDYLDGALADKESAELMHQLSVSPERRVILEQHLQLNNLVADARKPHAVPAALEARLAERLPAIARYNREIAISTGVITASRMPMLKRIASTVAVLLLITSAGYFGFIRDNSELIATVDTDQSATPEMISGVKDKEPVVNTPIQESGLSRNNALTSWEEEVVIAHYSFEPVEEPSNSQLISEAINEFKLGPIDHAMARDVRPVMNVNNEARLQAIHLPASESWNLPLALRIDYGFAQSYNQVRESDASITHHNALSPTVGIDYLFSSRIAVGFEGGEKNISRVEEITSVTNDEELGIKHVTISHDIVSRPEFNMRAMLRYTFNPYDRVRLEASVGGGAAFGDHISPLVSWGVVLHSRITDGIDISVGPEFTGTFARSGASTPIPTSNEPVAYDVIDQAASTSLFTPSFVLKAGLRVTPW